MKMPFVLWVWILGMVPADSLRMSEEKYPLSLAEARKVMGEDVRITEDKDSVASGYFRHKYTFSTLRVLNATGQPSNLFYVYEQYANIKEAEKVCEDVRMTNQGLSGFEKVKGLGDEALYHTDARNFRIIIARKGNKIIRMKVNKITEKTSHESLRSVAAEVIGRI